MAGIEIDYERPSWSLRAVAIISGLFVALVVVWVFGSIFLSNLAATNVAVSKQAGVVDHVAEPKPVATLKETQDTIDIVRSEDAAPVLPPPVVVASADEAPAPAFLPVPLPAAVQPPLPVIDDAVTQPELTTDPVPIPRKRPQILAGNFGIPMPRPRPEQADQSSTTEPPQVVEEFDRAGKLP